MSMIGVRSQGPYVQLEGVAQEVDGNLGPGVAPPLDVVILEAKYQLRFLHLFCECGIRESQADDVLCDVIHLVW